MNENYNSFPGLLDFVEGQLSCRGVELILQAEANQVHDCVQRVGESYRSTSTDR
jgi:hypothetical protein